jgi:glucose/arabinose dehydrogenase
MKPERIAAGLCAILVAGVAASQTTVASSPPAQIPPSGSVPGPPPPARYMPPAPGQPAETQPPGAKDQMPAFKEQTRAPYAPSNVALNVETLSTGLESPWGMEFLPDGRILVTERKGRMRILSGGRFSPPVAGLPSVHVQETAGLEDVIRDPNFTTNQLLYWSFIEKRPSGAGVQTSVARGRLVDGATPRLDDVTVIYRQIPDLKSEHVSFGGRLAFDRSGALFVTLGDLYADNIRPYIQKMDSSVGKLVRISTDGKAASGNPFIGKPSVLPEIWAVGFRSPLGAAFRPGTDELWTTDVGPRGGDELNVMKPGKNYGCPVISYGKEYTGDAVGAGTQKKGYEQPIYYWDPVISPSSLAFYGGKLFPQWRGNAFVTSLTQRQLVRLVLKGRKVVGEERLLSELNERLREVKEGPDGALYLLTDSPRGKLLRLTPR